jgi:ankyrin repeat protein
MLDRGDIRRHEALQGGCRFLLASVLASSIVCSQLTAANAQGFEKFFTNPRLAEKSTAAKIASDALALSADQALWAALAFEDNDQLQQLLKHGANANTTEELSLMTPLMAAEALPLAWTLLEAGANPRARDRTGKTPLHYAPKMRDGALIIPLLARAGADVNARADEPASITPLFCAIENYFEGTDKTAAIQVIRVMVQYGADINVADSNGATVLAIAAAHNRPELIKLLVELGADPTKRLGNGRTPLDYAKEANATDAIQLLAGTTSGALTGN